MRKQSSNVIKITILSVRLQTRVGILPAGIHLHWSLQPQSPGIPIELHLKDEAIVMKYI